MHVKHLKTSQTSNSKVWRKLRYLRYLRCASSDQLHWSPDLGSPQAPAQPWRWRCPVTSVEHWQLPCYEVPWRPPHPRDLFFFGLLKHIETPGFPMGFGDPKRLKWSVEPTDPLIVLHTSHWCTDSDSKLLGELSLKYEQPQKLMNVSWPPCHCLDNWWSEKCMIL